jgi:hypothetical protein
MSYYSIPYAEGAFKYTLYTLTVVIVDSDEFFNSSLK